MLKLISLFSLCLSLLISCQDNKTKANIPSIKPEQIITKMETPSIKVEPIKISNKTVTDFLLDYGKKNNEHIVELETDFGSIRIELFDETPLHHANFIHLINRGFFNETCFYRVSKGFVIQGGNSDRMEMAKIKNNIGEFTLPAEFKPHLKHRYGSVAMARNYKNNLKKRSNAFEFYIVVNPNGAKHLDNEHTVFGKVIKGMDVAKKINVIPVDYSEWPKRDVYMKARIIE